MILSKECVDGVLRHIDARREDSIDLLKDLIRINSTNPNFPGVAREEVIGGETRVNEILGERLEEAGARTEWVAPDPERKNLVGVIKGTGGGRSLVLNGHVDTVPPAGLAACSPAGLPKWTVTEPWSPLVREDVLYGLGSTDMKAGLVAAWLALQGLADANQRPAGDVVVQSVVGEERMEHEVGTTACLRAGFTGDAAVVLEPSSTPLPLTVSPVSAGNWVFRIVVPGRSTHAGNRAGAIRPGGAGAALGVNAVEKGVDILHALHALEDRWAISKAHPFFSPGFFTILPGLFHSDAGYPSTSFFADYAVIQCVLWYPPDEQAEDVAKEVEVHIESACDPDPWLRINRPRFEWLKNCPPANTPWQHPFVRTIREANELVTGRHITDPTPLQPVAFGAVSDASFLEAAGIPGVVYGPGDIRVAHTRDESVSISEMVLAAKTLARTIIAWCG